MDFVKWVAVLGLACLLARPVSAQSTKKKYDLDLKIANLLRDEKILKYARDLAREILEKDPNLSKAENKILKHSLQALNKFQPDWGSVS